jgi:hypothetical protein
VGSDVPSVTGTGASGTWSININGNAATATSATSASTASTATNVTGTVAVANGGTGATTASSARSNLGLVAVAASGSAADLSTGTLADARVASSNVTQYQTSLTIAETQITDGSLLARVAGNETISGTWSFSNATTIAGITNSGREIASGILTPSAIGSNANDYAPGITGISVLRISASVGGLNLTGISGGTAGQVLQIWNVGTTNAITLTNEDTNSTAANRLLTQNQASKVMQPGCLCWALYDSTVSRWRVAIGV